jgi:hypothetical protein
MIVFSSPEHIITRYEWVSFSALHIYLCVAQLTQTAIYEPLEGSI